MTQPLHHPNHETLARYAAGTLPGGPALVTAAHLALCESCSRQVAMLEAVGGALLQDLPPVALADDALAHTLARIERLNEQKVEEISPLPPAWRKKLDLPPGIVLPAVLNDHEIGPWRWLAPGIRWSKVHQPGSRKTDAMLLRIGAGRKLPLHTHDGTEFTLVLSGSFTDQFGRYAPGDLEEADGTIEHRPIADAATECFCLAAVEGEMRMRSLIARLVQPLAGL